MSSKVKKIREETSGHVTYKFRGEILIRWRSKESARELYVSKSYVLKFCAVQCPSERETWSNLSDSDRKYFAAIVAYGEDWSIQKRVRCYKDDEYDADQIWWEMERKYADMADYYGFSNDFKRSQYVFCSKRRRWLCVDYATEW